MAVKFCAHCEAFYCNDCVEQHNSILSHHPIEDVLSDQVAKELPTEVCREHMKTIDLYCKQHDQLGCSTCMALDHR